MSRAMQYAVLVPASEQLGESTFAAARSAIQDRYGVSPVEVFLDVVRVDGVINAGDVLIDLGQLGVRYLGFGADDIPDFEPPLVTEATPAQPVPVIEPDEAPAA